MVLHAFSFKTTKLDIGTKHDEYLGLTFCPSPKYSSYFFFEPNNYLLYFLFKSQVFIMLFFAMSNFLFKCQVFIILFVSMFNCSINVPSVFPLFIVFFYSALILNFETNDCLLFLFLLKIIVCYVYLERAWLSITLSLSVVTYVLRL